MTTKAKTQKFRMRRGPRAADDVTSTPEPQQAAPRQPTRPARPAPGEQLFDNGARDDGFGDAPFPGSAAAQRTAMHSAAPMQLENPQVVPQRPMKGAVAQSLRPAAQSGEVTTAAEMALDQEIDAIRKEGLTGKQLRMARRVAQKHGIAAVSDFDAVRQLRAQGIDPFKKNALLDIVSTRKQPAPGKTNLPKVVESTPLPDMFDRAQVDEEVSRIQRDIVRRRRRKLALLTTRLFVFIGIPTFLAGLYYYTMATPMYATESAFVIQTAEAPAAGAGGLGGLLSGSPLGGSQDSIAVQDYLESRQAMLRLDEEVGFKEHFASDQIDVLQRLDPDATNEEAYKAYSKHLTISYNPTEGLIKMSVVAADPEVSKRFSETLIRYAEEEVDKMTARVRADQETGAREGLDDSEAKMLAAQEKVIELQEQLGILSPDAETQSIMGQITGFEKQVQEKRLQLQQLLDNPNPNQARVDGVRGDIRRLENLITELRSDLTQAQRPEGSLARITAELRMAEVELEARQAMVQQSMQSLEAARVEASRQVRYLSLSSQPIAPDEPTHPKKFENTLIAFFIFCGIYLMVSLTAAVLREQVST